MRPDTDAAVMESESIPEHIEKLVTSIALENGISKPRLDVSACSAAGDNFIGKLIRVVVKDEDNEKADLALVVKTPPRSKQRRELFRVGVHFQNEAHVYQHVLPALADCYKQKGLLDKDAPFPCTAKPYACVTSNDEYDVIVLEDLRQRGFVMGNRKVGMDEPQCRLVLRELARIHAASLALQKTNPELHDTLVARLTENIFIERKQGDVVKTNTFAQRCRDLIQRRFPEGTEERAKFESFAENFSDRMRSFLKKDTKFLAITHGDPWTNNFLFKYDKETSIPIEVCLLDFQIVRLASPVLDLSYLLLTSTSKALRDAHYHDLLRYYYKNLVENLDSLGVSAEEIITWELFEEELKRFSGYGWGMAMLVVPIFLAEQSDVIGTDEEMNEDDGIHLIRSSTVNTVNEERMSGVLEDAIRLGYL